MPRSSRRSFLQTATAAGLACSADSLLAPLAWARSQGGAASAGGNARVYFDTRRCVSSIDRNLFGSFLEHLGRAIYEGIYDPGSKLADSNGFRKDTLEEIRK